MVPNPRKITPSNSSSGVPDEGIEDFVTTRLPESPNEDCIDSASGRIVEPRNNSSFGLREPSSSPGSSPVRQQIKNNCDTNNFGGSPSSSSSTSSVEEAPNFGLRRQNSEPDSDDSGISSAIEKLSRKMGRLFQGNDPLDEEPLPQQQPTSKYRDPLSLETEWISHRVIFHFLEISHKNSLNNSYSTARRKSFYNQRNVKKEEEEISECLVRCVSQMLDKHKIKFPAMIRRLRLNETHLDGDQVSQGFSQLCDELFAGDECSWEKIVALFSFSTQLAKCLAENERNSPLVIAEKISETLTKFAIRKLTPFLLENGGWVTICEAFPKSTNLEDVVQKSMLYTLGTLGALSAAIYVFNR